MKRASCIAGWLVGSFVGLSTAAIVVVAGGAVSAPPAAAQEALVTLTATPTGELAVSPTDIDLRLVNAAVAGTFTLFNQTGTQLNVTIKGVGDEGELASRLEAHITANGVPVFDGVAVDIADGSAAFLLDSGEVTTLVVTLTLSDGGCPYCSGLVELRFDTTPAAEES